MVKKRPTLIPPETKKEKPTQPQQGQMNIKNASVLHLKAAMADEFMMIETCKQKMQQCQNNINAINAELVERGKPVEPGKPTERG